MFGRSIADDLPVFTLDGSTPVRPDTLTHAWRRVAKALGLNLRHSAATLMLVAGSPLSKPLRHAGLVYSRQREVLTVIAALKNGDTEFTVQEIVSKSNEQLANPFSNGHVNQLLNSLTKVGLVCKNRYPKYSLAVPMLAGFINRQEEERQLSLNV